MRGIHVAIGWLRLSNREIEIDPAVMPRNSPAINFDSNNVLPGRNIN
jgi:hypothetical protein